MIRIRAITTLGMVISSCAALFACSQAVSDESEESVALGTVSSAMTKEMTRVFGFEIPEASWTLSQGASASTSTEHSEGAFALRVDPSGYTTIQSPAMSQLVGVTNRVSLDFQPERIPAWGGIQLLVTIPGTWCINQPLSYTEVRDLPGGEFTRLEFSVPPNVEAALKGSYKDMFFTIALNMDPAVDYGIFDNLRFVDADCTAGTPYTVNFHNPSGLSADYLQDMRCMIVDGYSLMVDRFNPSAQTTVDIWFEPVGGHGAYADGSGIHIGNDDIIDNPAWPVFLMHELMHVVQAYSNPHPWWAREGIADYVYYTYGETTILGGTDDISAEVPMYSLPPGYAYGQHYSQGYEPAAAFFIWIDEHYGNRYNSVITGLDDELRAGTYDDNATWMALVGRSVDSLWAEYSGYSAPPPATQGITTYPDANFEGRPVMLDVGSYQEVDLKARGVPADDIRSMVIPAGYTVTAYPDDGFSGTPVTFTADTAYVGDYFEADGANGISSLVVTQ